jgi:hypothetical protein
MKNYKIKQTLYYDLLDIELIIDNVMSTEDEANKIGYEMELIVELYPDHLKIIKNNEVIQLMSNERDKYKFFLNNSDNLGQPISIQELNQMSTEQKLSLLEDPRYEIKLENSVEMNWSLYDAFDYLHNKTPKKNSYNFSSCSYSVELDTINS